MKQQAGWQETFDFLPRQTIVVQPAEAYPGLFLTGQNSKTRHDQPRHSASRWCDHELLHHNWLSMVEKAM